MNPPGQPRGFSRFLEDAMAKNTKKKPGGKKPGGY